MSAEPFYEQDEENTDNALPYGTRDICSHLRSSFGAKMNRWLPINREEVGEGDPEYVSDFIHHAFNPDDDRVDYGEGNG